MEGESFGFIHDKLDVKILILFILRRLPSPVSYDALAELSLCDGGITYFDFAECLSELSKSGHVSESDGMFTITEKGKSNSEVTESGLPYSTRLHAEQNASALAEKLRRSELIQTSNTPRIRGGDMVCLSMSDGIGPVLDLSLLVGDREQAKRIEHNFQEHAEEFYEKIMMLLMSEDASRSKE